MLCRLTHSRGSHSCLRHFALWLFGRSEALVLVFASSSLVFLPLQVLQTLSNPRAAQLEDEDKDIVGGACVMSQSELKGSWLQDLHT